MMGINWEVAASVPALPKAIYRSPYSPPRRSLLSGSVKPLWPSNGEEGPAEQWGKSRETEDVRAAPHSAPIV